MIRASTGPDQIRIEVAVPNGLFPHGPTTVLSTEVPRFSGQSWAAANLGTECGVQYV